MLDIKDINLNREQLLRVFKNHRAITEFERLFIQDKEIAEDVNNNTDKIINIIAGVGLTSEGKYIQRTLSNYLNSSSSIYEDITILDKVSNTSKIKTITTGENLVNESITLLCDCTAGDITAKLPPPSSQIKDGYSYKISISKIDNSSNKVIIIPNNTELICNESDQELILISEVLNFITDGTNWYLDN